MSNGNANDYQIVVTGDVTIDWNLAKWSQYAKGSEWEWDDTVRACPQDGGVLMLARLLDEVSKGLAIPNPPQVKLRSVQVPDGVRDPGDKRFRHSYVLWEAFAKDATKKDSPQVWRTREFMGLNGAPRQVKTQQWEQEWYPWDASEANLVVIDDAGLGFRGLKAAAPVQAAPAAGSAGGMPPVTDEQAGEGKLAAVAEKTAGEIWPDVIRNGTPRWILAKMAPPVAEGELWDQLVEAHADRTIVVVTAGSIRRARALISQQLSWERTAQDLYYELRHHYVVGALSKCRHVIVSLGTAGALRLSRVPKAQKGEEGAKEAGGTKGEEATKGAEDEKSDWECVLHYDPATIEDQWKTVEHPGEVVGYTTALTAALARELIASPERPRLDRGIRRGIHAMRLLQEIGYGEVPPPDDGSGLEYPYEQLARAIGDRVDAKTLALRQIPVKDPAQQTHQGTASGRSLAWTILGEKCRGNACLAAGPPVSIEQLAVEVVLKGEKAALKGVPLGQFADLTTADRQEIEAFRAVENLIREYHGNLKLKTPVSIAVFGPPGAGKSFGIKQVAASVAKDAFKEMTFNLSQLSGPEELIGALHQVRDIALSGQTPLIFWDEFDTSLDNKELGWLRYFLAPMQDGEFQDRQITHKIGRAIFVFAGGTRRTLEEFDRCDTRDEGECKGFRDVKGPDFISRLRGYVDILGPNPQPVERPELDPTHIIRRAVILRGMLGRNVPQIFSEEKGQGEARVDPGVLQAFLGVRKYRHGVRSMEAILGMCQLTDAKRLDRSNLPSEDQLALHVNPREFMALVQALPLEANSNDPRIRQLVQDLAVSTHGIYSKNLLAQVGNDPSQVNGVAFMKFEDLTEDLQAQNVAQVRDIPRKLMQAGYAMVPARSGEPAFKMSDKLCEKLSRMEHDRYMRLKAAQGFKYGPERNSKPENGPLTNPTMLPWDAMTEDQLKAEYPDTWEHMKTHALPDDEKAKDLAFMRLLPHLLAERGYTIMPLDEDEPEESAGRTTKCPAHPEGPETAACTAIPECTLVPLCPYWPPGRTLPRP